MDDKQLRDMAQDIGRLEGSLAALQRTVDENRISSAAGHARLEAKIDGLTAIGATLKEGQDRFKGGYAAISVLASVAAALGSAVTWAIGYCFK